MEEFCLYRYDDGLFLEHSLYLIMFLERSF